jgi:hypothetical protein
MIFAEIHFTQGEEKVAPFLTTQEKKVITDLQI